MENIRVRDYVRTHNGEIFQIVGMKQNKDLTMYITNQYGQYSEIVLKEDMKKCSKDIMDLVEDGDILKIKESNSIHYLSWNKETDISLKELKEELNNKEFELLAIITKEQAKMIEFEVM